MKIRNIDVAHWLGILHKKKPNENIFADMNFILLIGNLLKSHAVYSNWLSRKSNRRPALLKIWYTRLETAEKSSEF